MKLVAPVHLLIRLLRGVLGIVFILLQSNKSPHKLRIHLRSSLDQNVSQSQPALYKTKNQEIKPELTMTPLYCLLTLLRSTLKALRFLEQLPS